MLVSSISVVPVRGSLDLISTGTFKAVEIQVVRTIVIACVLPIAPAGMVSVTCVPAAVTELMVSVPRLTVAIWIPLGGAGRKARPEPEYGTPGPCRRIPDPAIGRPLAPERTVQP